MTYERTRITADTTLYASPTGAGAMDGSGAEHAFPGVQAAWDALQRDYDLNGKTATIQLLNGTYTQGLQGYGSMLGLQKPGGSPVIIRGDITAAQVIFNTPGVNTFSLDGGAIATIVNMTISAAGGYPLYTTLGATIEYGSIRFGTAAAHVMADIDGRLVCTGSCVLVQGAAYHISANRGYVGIVPGVALHFGENIGFAGAFAIASNHGQINIPIPGVSFVGICTGTKGYASLGGIINASGNASSLPGTGACGSNYGGQVY